MLTYEKQKKIQLHITTWTSQSGQLFDFNTKDFQQANNFKTCQYLLPIPKHKQSQHYYFLHQLMSTVREQKNKFVIQRRMTFQSHFDFQQYRARNYKLVGCFKVFMKKISNTSDQYVPCIKVLQTSKATIKKGKQVDQKIENQRPYLVVKTFEKGYPLKLGQIVKLGKTQLKVQQIELDPNLYQIQQQEVLHITQNSTHYAHQTIRHKLEQSFQNQPSDDGSTVPTCKICYEKDETDNPLINPCKCKGLIGFIHVGCLKNWLQTKLKNNKTNQDHNSHVYNTKQLFCQICRQKFPKKVIFGNKQFILLNFMEQFQPYVALQNVHDIQANPNHLMFVTFPECSTTTIGRLDDNGMILIQNSVSRRHAQIFMNKQNKCLMLKDTDSKYGTLVYQQDAQFRLHSKLRAIEIGNSVFSFKIV